MKKIIWSDQFSVGVREMDVQHQRVIKIFNRLVDNARDNARSENVSEALAELVEYASEHFKREEQLLRDHGHPDLAHQEREHRAFRRQVGELCLIASTEDESVVHDLLAFLHDWWTNHILVEDKKYATLLLERRESYRGNRFASHDFSVTRYTEFDR